MYTEHLADGVVHGSHIKDIAGKVILLGNQLCDFRLSGTGGPYEHYGLEDIVVTAHHCVPPYLVGNVVTVRLDGGLCELRVVLDFLEFREFLCRRVFGEDTHGVLV